MSTKYPAVEDDGALEVHESVERFEDLLCWQSARELTRKVYSFTNNGEVRRDYGLADQIRRAVVSGMNNIAEGFERDSNKDFVKFLFIAKGSVGEVRSMLYVAFDLGYIDEQDFQHLLRLCEKTGKLCWGMIRSLQKHAGWKSKATITGMVLFASLSPKLFHLLLSGN